MPRPCEALLVVDFTQSYPGALATMVLADSGAEVIKVEPPSGDPTRQHYASVMWNRGKKSVVLDLKTDNGRADAQRLASRADVVVESFRPGVADRLGVGYRDLRSSNQEL
ncbi:MAG: CoA transferase, partial [Chloroflexi bacterium]|nr:CoA transferase [Chloroflexota bacterium]